MVLRETIISKHIIKPSSPTPEKLKVHKLSYIDQIAGLAYIPLIFFYENKKSSAAISDTLRKSLSHILTVFPPFAGTIRENSYVDCDDTGVDFIEARVHCRLTQVTNEPHMEQLKKLSPVDSSSHNESHVLLVKLNFFDCGAFALGVCLSHKVADMASLVFFMDAWATTCRGETPTVEPNFDAAVYFPQKNPTPPCFPPDKEEITTYRLVFDRETLAKLKKQVTCDEVKNPTRVEALTVFFWKQFMEANRVILGLEKKRFGAHHSVNVRPRTIPPIPDHTIGALALPCFAFTCDDSNLISKLRVTLKGVDDSYIKKVNSEEFMKMVNEEGELFTSSSICFSSWCRFPYYKVDFGCGKPVWVGITTMAYKNTVILTSTPSEDGIEAWVNMSEDFFQILQTNYNKLISSD